MTAAAASAVALSVRMASATLALCLPLAMPAAWAQPAAPQAQPSAPGNAPAPPAPVPAACVLPADVTPQHLYGLWRAEFEGLAQGATVLLEKHRELAESFSGAINRDGTKAVVAGDVDEGEFTMEESADGIHIAATWLGTVVAGACGREIRGSWQRAQDKTGRGFVLRRQGGWE